MLGSHRGASTHVQSTSTLGPGPAWPEALLLLTGEDRGRRPVSRFLTDPTRLGCSRSTQSVLGGPVASPRPSVTSVAWP